MTSRRKRHYSRKHKSSILLSLLNSSRKHSIHAVSPNSYSKKWWSIEMLNFYSTIRLYAIARTVSITTTVLIAYLLHVIKQRSEIWSNQSARRQPTNDRRQMTIFYYMYLRFTLQQHYPLSTIYCRFHCRCHGNQTQNIIQVGAQWTQHTPMLALLCDEHFCSFSCCCCCCGCCFKRYSHIR